MLSLIFHGCVSTYPHHMLQPIRTLQAPPSSATKTRKESTIGETLANFASSLMGGSKHKNVTKEKEQKTEKEVQPRSTKAGENSQCLKIAQKKSHSTKRATFTF